MTADEKLNAATNALKKVLSAVQRHLPPDGISEREAMGEIIEAVDPWPLGDTVGVESKRTAEDKIEEVMGVIDSLAVAATCFGVYRSMGNEEQLSARQETSRMRAEIESKLHELIKDDK